MSILSKQEIHDYCIKQRMIENFVPKTVREQGHISFGLGECSYDPRLQSEVAIFKSGTDIASMKDTIIDPKNFDQSCCNIVKGAEIVIPPHGFLIGYTIESFNIPNDVFGICLGKSTYARCGIVVNPSCIQPGQQGSIIIELSNTTSLPVKIYTGEKDGICVFIFYKVSECDSYNGRYQKQHGITFPSKL